VAARRPRARAASPRARCSPNPFAGAPPLDDHSALVERIRPRGYGKAALVGTAGDLEHGAAMIHVHLGLAMRQGARGPGYRDERGRPGAIETDFGWGAVRDNAQLNAFVASQTALGRAGLPDDIGGVIASLLAPENRWINAHRGVGWDVPVSARRQTGGWPQSRCSIGIGSSRTRLPVAWKDRVGDRRRRPNHHDLPQPLEAGGIGERVRPVDQTHIDFANVGVHRHDMVGQVVVEKPAMAWVDLGWAMSRFLG
jgi:Amino acid synthesis